MKKYLKNKVFILIWCIHKKLIGFVFKIFSGVRNLQDYFSCKRLHEKACREFYD